MLRYERERLELAYLPAEKIKKQRGYCDLASVSQSSSVVDTWEIFVEHPGE